MMKLKGPKIYRGKYTRVYKPVLKKVKCKKQFPECPENGPTNKSKTCRLCPLRR